MERTREYWIDLIKLLACALVALGHFFQSMIAAGILPATQWLQWFDQTIYYFHVPLFFLCSGYLYQKTCDASASAWKKNLIKKGIVLGIPYFFFSFVTWGLKILFSGAVNIQSQGLAESLFLTPISPYWYLYVLFGIFVVTPPFRNKKTAWIGLICAVVLKIVQIVCDGIGVYMVEMICASEIWFVLGMCLCIWELPEKLRAKTGSVMSIFAAGIFWAASVLIYRYSLDMQSVAALMGLAGCTATVLLVLHIQVQGNVIKRLTQYTMPIFLMHTIFAAGVRAVLLKLGIAASIIHVALGLMASFVGPIVAAEIMKRLKLDVLYEPGKYIKLAK